MYLKTLFLHLFLYASLFVFLCSRVYVFVQLVPGVNNEKKTSTSLTFALCTPVVLQSSRRSPTFSTRALPTELNLFDRSASVSPSHLSVQFLVFFFTCSSSFIRIILGFFFHIFHHVNRANGASVVYTRSIRMLPRHDCRALRPFSLSFFLSFIVSVMSSFTVSGFFGLASGRHEALTSSANKTTNYISYDSSFTCSNGTSSPILIRHFSPQHAVLPDNTIIYLIAKAGFPSVASDPIVFHALYFYPIPGDASSEEYENTVPDMLHPVAHVIGHVTAPLSSSADSMPRSFAIHTSSYVSTGTVSSSIAYASHSSTCLSKLSLLHSCVLANTRRWAKPPNISLGSCIAVIGSFSSIASNNQLSIAVDDLTLGLSAKTESASPVSSATSPKRKFTAYVPRKTAATSST